jgi:DNA-nicking Smr family endonuclease
MKDASPAHRGRLRRLSDEEIALWLTVAKSVTPRPDAHLPDEGDPPPKMVSAPAAPTATPAPREKAAVRAPSVPGLAPLERRLRQKLSRGQAEVDAAIDLHGLTQAEAHGALHHFLAGAQNNGAKLVLVVTGKGEARPSTDSGATGVLRRAVPLWLKAPEWRVFVVGFEEASRPHGGAGALYVRLRRRDKRDR